MRLLSEDTSNKSVWLTFNIMICLLWICNVNQIKSENHSFFFCEIYEALADSRNKGAPANCLLEFSPDLS